MELNKYLEKIGLSDNEQVVYLACLEIGESQITPIVDQSEIPRTTVYYILERLHDMELVEIFQRNSRRVYKPTPPRQILTLLKNRQTKMAEDIANFEDALPELAKLYINSPFQPKVKVYKGKDIRKLYAGILDEPIDQVCHVSETSTIIDLLGKSFVKKVIQRRADLKIRSRSIRVETEEIDDSVLHPKGDPYRTVRYAPKEFRCPTHIIIYGDNVAFLTSSKESFGVQIISRDIAQSMQNWFNQLWKQSRSANSGSKKR